MHEFTLNDADGNPHSYVIVARHNITDGHRLMRRLQALIAGPLGGLIDGLAGGKGSSSGSTGPELVRALASIEDMTLVRQLLAHVSRDGVLLSGPTALKALNDAYQGNYGEMDAACYEVIKHNRFLSLPAGMSGVLRVILAKVQAKVADTGAATSSEPPPSE